MISITSSSWSSAIANITLDLRQEITLYPRRDTVRRVLSDGQTLHFGDGQSRMPMEERLPQHPPASERFDNHGNQLHRTLQSELGNAAAAAHGLFQNGYCSDAPEAGVSE